MVAFLVLMGVLGILYKMVSFSSELRMKAADISTVMTNFDQEVLTFQVKGFDAEAYNNRSIYTKAVEYETDATIDEDGKTKGPVFYLIESSGEDENAEVNRIWMSSLSAYGFSYKTDEKIGVGTAQDMDNIVYTEQISAPKSIYFVHDNTKKALNEE